MPLIQTTNWDTAGNFTFDAGKVAISGDTQLTLINNPGLTFAQDFSSSAGFVFDAAKAEFTGGLVRQKDQTATNSLMATKFTTTALNWHKSGSTAATLNGAPTLVGGKLQCFGTQGLYYILPNAPLLSIKFKYTPNYTGAPSTNRDIVGRQDVAGGTNSRLMLSHSSVGDTFRITMTDSVGVNYHGATTIGGSPNLISGTEYEIELTANSTSGNIRLFLNGTLHGTLSSAAWATNTNSMRYYVGAQTTTGSYDTANASFDEVIWFDNIQHTTTYTPGYTVAPFIYAETKVEMPVLSYTGLGTIQAITALTSTQAGTPKYVVNDLYFSGTWVSSSGAYSQANTLSEILTNQATFPYSTVFNIDVVFPDQNAVQGNIDQFDMTYTGQLFPTDNPSVLLNASIGMTQFLDFSSTYTANGGDEVKFNFKYNGLNFWVTGGAVTLSNNTYAESNTTAELQAFIASQPYDVVPDSDVQLRAFLHSNDGSTTPILNQTVIEYNFWVDSLSLQSCVVYGYVYDQETVVSGAQIAIKTKTPFYHNGNLVAVNLVATTNANGYFSVTLPDSNGNRLIAKTTFTDSLGKLQKKTVEIIVPNVPTEELENIIAP